MSCLWCNAVKSYMLGGLIIADIRSRHITLRRFNLVVLHFGLLLVWTTFFAPSSHFFRLDEIRNWI